MKMLEKFLTYNYYSFLHSLCAHKFHFALSQLFNKLAKIPKTHITYKFRIHTHDRVDVQPSFNEDRLK